MQEKMVQQWAEAKGCWFPHAEQDIESEYGTMIAEGAEAKVYLYKFPVSVSSMSKKKSNSSLVVFDRFISFAA